MNSAQFLFTCCQLGAEGALKNEIQRTWPTLRFAYSRPGFVTFKNTAERKLATDFELKSVFARTYGFSFGKVEGDEASDLARRACELAAGHKFAGVHVWQRDTHQPGGHGFQPGVTLLSQELGQTLLDAANEAQLLNKGVRLNKPASAGDLILDAVLIEPNLWWIGQHTASSRVLRQPGGVFQVTMPDHAVSRAYLKMSEALRWSQLPVAEGDNCVEIGSSPGGSCQTLLDQGLTVTGIDPAAMDPVLMKHPNFTHIKKRGSDLKRREYSDFKWLMADSIVTPKHTLDTVENIVTHDAVRIQGMLLTLKLTNWGLAEELANYTQRIQAWGYRYIRVRQLAHNRREVCVAVLKNRSMRRLA